MQRELIFSLLEDVNFTDSANNARFDVVRAINLRQMNGYMLSKKVALMMLIMMHYLVI